MKVSPYFLIGCFAASLIESPGQSLILNPSAVPPIQHIYSVQSGTRDVQSFTFSTPSTSLARYNAIQVNFSAPAGYAWQVDANGTGGNYFSYGIAFDSVRYVDKPLPTDYRFDFVAGSLQNSGGGNLYSAWVSATGFGFNASYFELNGVMEFTNLTVTMHYNPNTLDMQPLNSFVTAQLYFQCGGAYAPEADQHMALVPVPEPSCVSLFVLAGIVCARRKRFIQL